MRGSLIFGALLALVACLYVPYEYHGNELILQKSTGTSFHRPIDGVTYAPLWAPPDKSDLSDHTPPADYTVLPFVEGVTLDVTRLAVTLAAVAALTALIAAASSRPRLGPTIEETSTADAG